MDGIRIIDADGHVEEPESLWPEYLEARYHHLAPMRVIDNQGRTRIMVGGQMIPYKGPKAPNAEPPRPGGSYSDARIPDMEMEGLDVAVLYPSLGLPMAAIDRLDAIVALDRAYNNWLADYCKGREDRLIGIALVPQIDIYEAMEETKRCVDQLGFRGIAMRPNVMNGRTIDHPAYDPLWNLLEELDVPVTIHEGTTQNIPLQAGTERYDNYLMVHAVSHPHEQQMALMSLICGGVLDRHPKLRVGFLESGAGWIGHWLDRLEHHVEHLGYLSFPLSLRPREYFLRQCYISADPDESMIPGTIAALGDDNLLFATDYPHSDGFFPTAVSTLSAREDISPDSKRKMMQDNPIKLYNLPAA